MSEEKQSATDLLLSLERKIDLILKYYKNMDNNLKLVLNQINSQKSENVTIVDKKVSIPEELKVINKDNFENRIKTNKFEEFAASRGIDASSETEEESDDKLLDSPSGRGNLSQRGVKAVTKTGGKSVITQSIINKDGNNLYLASVEITDAVTGDLIKQCRTNTAGKWMAQLQPGDYTVKITKQFPAEKNMAPINVTYNVTTPPSLKPMELNPFIIK